MIAKVEERKQHTVCYAGRCVFSSKHFLTKQIPNTKNTTS